MNETRASAYEVHKVKNGWMIHVTRGWMNDSSATAYWDDRIWVFETNEGLFDFLRAVRSDLESSA